MQVGHFSVYLIPLSVLFLQSYVYIYICVFFFGRTVCQDSIFALGCESLVWFDSGVTRESGTLRAARSLHESVPGCVYRVAVCCSVLQCVAVARTAGTPRAARSLDESVSRLCPTHAQTY